MRIAQERGVMLIQVALVAFVMLGLAAFSVDYGAAWYARSQAQTAADAGALAGATALAMDNRTWPFPAGGIVETSAETTALLPGNAFYDKTPSVTTTAIATAVCPPFLAAPLDTHCVQVDVYRDGTNGSTVLPTYFANLFGVNSQGVLATATAQVVEADTGGCVRPWFIMDQYTDVNGNGRYDSPPDIYNSTTGYQVPRDLGAPVTFHPNTGPSAYGQIDVGSGAADIMEAIRYCDGSRTITKGSTVPTKPGASNGQQNAVDDLLVWDPDKSASNPNGVYYDSATKTVQGGCSAQANCSCGGQTCPYNGTQSPRIVSTALCAPTEADCTGDTTRGPGSIYVIEVLSFFVTGMRKVGGDLLIDAVLVSSAGSLSPGGAPGGGAGGAFVTFNRLVR